MGEEFLGFGAGIIYLSIPFLFTYLALKFSKYECKKGVFLISLQAYIILFLHEFAAVLIATNFNSLSEILTIFILFSLSSIVFISLLLMKSNESSEALFSYDSNKSNNTNLLKSIKTSVTIFIFTAVGTTVVFLAITSIAYYIEQKYPRPKLEFGFYEI
jgi:hypothetical protein